MTREVWEQVRELYAYREMLRNLVSKELRARYKGSWLGFLWTFANPLLMLAVYSFVFSFVMQVTIEHYAMFLFVALLPWNYLVQSVLQAAASIVQNAGLVKKVYFPRAVLPLSVVMANLVNYLLSLLILIPALALSGVPLTWSIAAFPAVLLAQTLLVSGLALLVAVGNVFFRDLEHIAGVLMNVWFFLTPIFYDITIVPDKMKPLFQLNPVTPMIVAYRSIFFYGEWPDWAALGRLIAGGSLFLLASLHLFVRAQRTVAEEI